MDTENFDKESFNEDFCIYLEYYLSGAFNDSDVKEIRTLWCDGVLMPANSWTLSKKYVNDKRRIETEAWTALDGRSQWLFKMTIYLGKYSLRRYAKGSDLTDCVPSLDSLDWINVDMEKKIIELQLK